ncbi:MAG: hypothetical protein FWG71_04860 [Synergistaceae bacterium]|nr:hypothetical protein [Synergistaceae bacterium]
METDTDNAELAASLDEKAQELEVRDLEITELKTTVEGLEQRVKHQELEIEALKIAISFTEKHAEALADLKTSILDAIKNLTSSPRKWQR